MTEPVTFDFGPISRTVDASTGTGDAINFASIAIHQATVALLASTNRDEFVAWLWHDLFKPLFWWEQRQKNFMWRHFPNTAHNDPLGSEQHWSNITNVPSGLVATHHARAGQRQFTYGESETVNNEFDQIAVGKNARFIQLSFCAEPATHTSLVRAVIADAFMEIVTQQAAQAIQNCLSTKTPCFSRVRYTFEFRQVNLSDQPSDDEVKQLAGNYSITFSNDQMSLHHVVPVRDTQLCNNVNVTIDLTPVPPNPSRVSQSIISLVELLTVYQDSRTILMGIPQFLNVDIGQLKQQILCAARQRFQNLDVRTLATPEELKKQSRTRNQVNWANLPLQRQGKEIDLLAHVLAEQVETRLIEHRTFLQKVKDQQNRTFQIRLLSDLTVRPQELQSGKSRCCRFCNTAFDSALPSGQSVLGDYFTDVEHVGFTGDICTMCRIYMLNSHKSRTTVEKQQDKQGDRKAYRGAFALLMPSSHFTYLEDLCQLMERPPLDTGGRFNNSLQRATVTLQEYNLFNMISRQIIAQIWNKLDNNHLEQPLPLPYLGAILFTQEKHAQVRALFEHLEALFATVELTAYPFRVSIQPSVELTFEMAVNDLKQHHTKHTYLKTSPTIIAVSPESKFNLLVDNGLQWEVSRQFFDSRKRLDELLRGMKDQKQKYNWLLMVLRGVDPVTAAVDALSDSDSPLESAEELFWDVELKEKNHGEQWQTYEQVRNEVQSIVSQYPQFIEFFFKPKRR